jgi:hypothetical protein
MLELRDRFDLIMYNGHSWHYKLHYVSGPASRRA